MPPGAKKRKQQARRKKAAPNHQRQQDEEPQESPTNPNPSPPVLNHRGSGDEEGEEMFKTPTFQPDLADESSSSRGKDEIKVNDAEVHSNGVGSLEAEESEDLDGSTEAEAVTAVAVEERAPEASIEQVEGFLRNGKEAKVVPWPVEETDRVPSVEAAAYENGMDADANGRVETEIVIDDGFKDLKLDDLAKDPVHVTENLMDVEIESVYESVLGVEERREDIEVVTGHEREVKSVPQVKETGETSPDDAHTETAPRIEIARGPLVVRRPSIWNCCGLFDVFTGSGS